MSPKIAAVLALTSLLFGGCLLDPCHHSCPTPSSRFVVTSVDGGTVGGVSATTTGAEAQALSCTPNPYAGDVAVCEMPRSAGSYSIEVSAPGFQTKDFSAIVTVATGSCNCQFATLVPSTVALSPD